MKTLNELIISKLDEIKKDLNNNLIKLVRIEVLERDKMYNWYLSIILKDYYTEAEINEIVIDVCFKNKIDSCSISADLSYGDGIIVKETSIDNLDSLLKGNQQSLILKRLEDSFFSTVNNEINKMIDDLFKSK